MKNKLIEIYGVVMAFITPFAFASLGEQYVSRMFAVFAFVLALPAAYMMGKGSDIITSQAFRKWEEGRKLLGKGKNDD